MGTAISCLVVAFVAAVVTVQVMAARQMQVRTVLPAQEALDVVRACFHEKFHHFERSGDTLEIRPRYKRHAPTLSARVEAAEGATVIGLWMSEWTTETVSFGRSGIFALPVGRGHALWILRKRWAVRSRLQKAAAVSPAIG
jgi:hypothetical protein